MTAIKMREANRYDPSRMSPLENVAGIAAATLFASVGGIVAGAIAGAFLIVPLVNLATAGKNILFGSSPTPSA